MALSPLSCIAVLIVFVVVVVVVLRLVVLLVGFVCPDDGCAMGVLDCIFDLVVVDLRVDIRKGVVVEHLSDCAV